MAFFESYGTLCGDAGVEFLEMMLKAGGFSANARASEVRACAVVALGKIGTPCRRGPSELGADSDVIVRNAVSRVLRGG